MKMGSMKFTMGWQIYILERKSTANQKNTIKNVLIIFKRQKTRLASRSPPQVL
jgi:hypothetical protein